MSTASFRPTVNVYALDGKKKETTPLPSVFSSPIRVDVVGQVHDLISLNRRQAQGVSDKAGHQTSAESWGTGRAVARIPRVRGGGTHRSGQAAYGNMCRGGHMFAPLQTWRKWHHSVPRQQRRYALASAIAASAIPALVEAKGHAIARMPEFPCVLSNEVEGITKTKEAVTVLRKLRAFDDVEKCIASKRIRGSKGKMRNRRWLMKKGPLVIYKNDNGIKRAFRGIPGVTLMSTKNMSILNLAPGGHVGRLIIWTKDAFVEMQKFFGKYRTGQTKLPTSIMKVTDLKTNIKNITSKHVIRKATATRKQIWAHKQSNPLKSPTAMRRLNPYYGALERERQIKERKAAIDAAKKPTKAKPAAAAPAKPAAKAQKGAAGKKPAKK